MKLAFRLLGGVLLAVALAVHPAAAQHAEQFELGAFGSYTRYDRAFLIENRVGFGGRFGYFLSERLGIEFDGNYATPFPLAATTATQVAFGSVSLVVNFPVSDRFLPYALGGYTYQNWGDAPPYNFVDHSVHGALGARFFMSRRWALRGEVRALYDPQTDLENSPGFTTATWGGQVVGSLGLSYFAAAPAPPRGTGEQRRSGRFYRWYWGGQAGVFGYKTNLQGTYFDPMVGAHWLITSKRTSLYVAFEQALFLTDAVAVIVDPASSTSSAGPGFRDVTFSDVRRIAFGVLAHPSQTRIEPYFGGGFALMQVLDPIVDCSACVTPAEAFEAQNLAEDAASKAFAWVMAGLQINWTNTLNFFGQLQTQSASQGYLLDGSTISIQVGARYSFGTSKEGLSGAQ
ncbi:MAG: porin family protein [Gemmatimonadales bacterium]